MFELKRIHNCYLVRNPPCLIPDLLDNRPPGTTSQLKKNIILVNVIYTFSFLLHTADLISTNSSDVSFFSFLSWENSSCFSFQYGQLSNGVHKVSAAHAPSGELNSVEPCISGNIIKNKTAAGNACIILCPVLLYY